MFYADKGLRFENIDSRGDNLSESFHYNLAFFVSVCWDLNFRKCGLKEQVLV